MVVLWAKRQILRLVLINKKGPIDQAGHAAPKVHTLYNKSMCTFTSRSIVFVVFKSSKLYFMLLILQ